MIDALKAVLKDMTRPVVVSITDAAGAFMTYNLVDEQESPEVFREILAGDSLKLPLRVSVQDVNGKEAVVHVENEVGPVS